MTEAPEPEQPMNDSGHADAIKIKHRATKRADGVAALSVLAGMRVCASALEAMRMSEDPFVRTALFSGIVVNYAKAFESVRDVETDTARRFSTKKLPPPFDRNLHEALLALRHKQIAHAGHALNDYNLTFMTATIEAKGSQPDGTIKQKKVRHIIGTRARASLACGIASSEAHDNLLAHVRALEAEASQRLAIAIIEHDAASMFRLEQQAKGHKVSTVLKTKKISAKDAGVVIFDEEDLAISLAKAPSALPLTFSVLHCHVVEQDGAFILKRLTVEE